MNRFAIPFYLAFYGSFFVGIATAFLISKIKTSEKVSSIISYFIAGIYSILPISNFVDFNSRMNNMTVKTYNPNFSLFDLNPTIIGIINILLYLAGWNLVMFLRKRQVQKRG